MKKRKKEIKPWFENKDKKVRYRKIDYSLKNYDYDEGENIVLNKGKKYKYKLDFGYLWWGITWLIVQVFLVFLAFVSGMFIFFFPIPLYLAIKSFYKFFSGQSHKPDISNFSETNDEEDEDVSIMWKK